ncbi:MAG TPA: rhamnulokinase family protein [Gemmataceae bacterium]|jgi:rhamnulokinase|nr:rhamnulokinase family protein [Gemmataceae bacterium]
MTTPNKFLAFDLGAESGRGIVGLLNGPKLELEVIHRFANEPVRTLDALHWDVLALYREMLQTMRLCASVYGAVDGVGVDTWGVDFALLGRGGTLLGNPRHYRDPHTEGVMDDAFRRVPRAEVFRQTGIQFMRFNTLFQLLALQRDRSPLLDAAETLLFMPDLFHYFFTGIKVNEFTDASTSQMLDPTTRGWAYGLVRSFGLPEKILGTLAQPGTVLGPLRPAVASETGLNPAPVIAPASHDTASAIAAVPASGDSWAYISSGTWSLMGVELSAPLVNEAALAANFTNEGGFGGTTRFLKNIMGLWLVQECRRAWERAGTKYSYDELTRLAQEAPPFAFLVDPDDASFILPASMPAALADYCRRRGKPAPERPGDCVRCALEGLALAYRWVLEKLEALTGRRREVIHVVGGGSQNALLCQFTADACNRPVLAGPAEATAIGNVLVQALGLGALRSLAEARAVVRQSFAVHTYTPQNPAAWEAPYEQFRRYREER